MYYDSTIDKYLKDWAPEMLLLAGLCVPVIRTDTNGLPSESGADMSYRKILIFDTGIILRILNMTMRDISETTTEILMEKRFNPGQQRSFGGIGCRS